VIGFLQPWALLGLLAAGIPPLLHLLGRRQPPTVVFPAVRYLSAAEREHSRRLKLRNLLLLALRVAAIVFVVLALSRPVVRIPSGSSHPPAALAVVVDNSLSSGAVVQGRPVLDVLRGRAESIVRRATTDDRLWLLTADGIPQPVTPAGARRLLDSLAPLPVRLDLDAAVRTAAALLAGIGLATREVVVLSDLQATAFSGGAPVDVRVLALEPPPVPDNLAIDSVTAEPRTWSPSGAVLAHVLGTSPRPTALRLYLDGLDVARTVVTAGDDAALGGTARRRGWLVGEARLDPDELRADDQRWIAVLATDPVPVRADSSAGPFVREGIAVLQDAGRLGSGDGVVLANRIEGRRSVVFPPSDPAMVGALNRALAARGVPWRLGAMLEGEWAIRGEPASAEGAAVTRRYRLEGAGTVLATAGGEPWLVREGDVTVMASRLDEGWSTLPTTAAFLPFLEALVTRVAVTVTGVVSARPGATVVVPSGSSALAVAQGVAPVGGDRRLVAPLEPGVYFTLGAAGDTVGAIEVNPDPRESLLTPAGARELRASWGPRAQLLGTAAMDRELFGGARRLGLATAFIVAALVAVIAELLVSTYGAARRPA